MHLAVSCHVADEPTPGHRANLASQRKCAAATRLWPLSDWADIDLSASTLWGSHEAVRHSMTCHVVTTMERQLSSHTASPCSIARLLQRLLTQRKKE